MSRLAGVSPRDLTPGAWLLRAVVALGPVVAVVAPSAQGYDVPLWFLVLLVAISLTSAWVADQYPLTVTMVLAVGYWALEVRAAMPVSVVVAAGGLLTSHVAATVVAYGPPGLPPDRPALLRWLRRGVLVWLVAPGLWLVIDVARGRATPASFWLAGLAVALVAAVMAATVFPTSLDRVGQGGFGSG